MATRRERGAWHRLCREQTQRAERPVWGIRQAPPFDLNQLDSGESELAFCCDGYRHMERRGMSGGIFMRALIAASLLLSAASALAHDARPAYLELVATDATVFELRWKHH